MLDLDKLPDEVIHYAPSEIIAERSDIQIILQLAKDNGGNASLVNCLVATGKPCAEVMKTLVNLCAQGLLEIGNHQDSRIMYRLV